MPVRDRVYRAEGVVLRRQNLGEADRLTTIFTLERGKLRLLAKGVRRPGSRKAGHLEPFSRVALLVARGRNLDLITQAEALETYPALQHDLDLLARGSYVVELLDRFSVEEGAENRSLYDLLVHTLDQLNTGREDPEAVVLFFSMRLLDLVGFRPELFHCLACGAEIKPQDQFFSFQQGGVLCPRCGRRERERQSISLDSLKILRHYQRSTFKAATTPAVRQKVFREIAALMEGYLTYLLERRLNTPAFLRELDHPAGYKIHGNAKE